MDIRQNIIKILFVMFSILFFSCNKSVKDKIVLTSGLSMNPKEMRFGIEINQDSIYYCEEKEEKKGAYNYYYINYKYEGFLNMKKSLGRIFRNEMIKSESVIDGTPYKIYTSFNKKKDSVKFYYDYLNDEQLKLIDKIKVLKKLKFKKISYHYFPTELLTEKLPPPPPPKKNP
ncbi:hypothetical protein LIS90_13365 [Flavobacterium psychrophilum]|uniref:hypothetical protein n=1 Tax=Flavobacterium psychrophilum TaxID=96345 RepID=UPI001D07753C|nr:hypothetical protein [Flavobacterium psychrophilum]EKT3958492.1 hypothetical protein [Flavobacterium psychrophilum]MCB6232235.1 hypothetical protein [Flavobacterium psychrophilum]